MEQVPKTITNNFNQVISYYKIRRGVGLIGISLPFVHWAGNYLLSTSSLTNSDTWIHYTGKKSYESLTALKPSISHFY